MPSADELDRAGRNHHTRDRRRFVAARAALRGLLASSLAVDERSVLFVRGRHGKPRLADGSSRLCFTVSRSQDLAVVGVALDGEVSVDVEHVREENLVLEQLTRRVLSVDELRAFNRIEPGAAKEQLSTGAGPASRRASRQPESG